MGRNGVRSHRGATSPAGAGSARWVCPSANEATYQLGRVREYLSYADDEPMMKVTSYEPLAITKGTPIERPEEGPLMGAGIVDRFTSIGLRPTAVVERLQSRMPRPTEAEHLDLRPGVPVIVIVRICYSGETPIETADLLLAANQYKLEYTLNVDPLQPTTD